MSSPSVPQVVKALRVVVVPQMPIALQALLSLISHINTLGATQSSLHLETNDSARRQFRRHSRPTTSSSRRMSVRIAPSVHINPNDDDEEAQSMPPLELVPTEMPVSMPLCSILDRLSAAEHELQALRQYTHSVEQQLLDHLESYCHRVHNATEEYSTVPPVIVRVSGSPEQATTPADNRMLFDMDSSSGGSESSPGASLAAQPERLRVSSPLWWIPSAPALRPVLSQRMTQQTRPPTIGDNALGLRLYNSGELEPSLLPAAERMSENLVMIQGGGEESTSTNRSPGAPGTQDQQESRVFLEPGNNNSQEPGEEDISSNHASNSPLGGSPSKPLLSAVEANDDLFDHEFRLDEDPPVAVKEPRGATMFEASSNELLGRRNTPEEPLKIRRHTD